LLLRQQVLITLDQLHFRWRLF